VLSFRESGAIEQWFHEFGKGRYDAEWLNLPASPTNNSYTRLDWTLFILNQELSTQNTYSGAKSFNIITD
jgi:hypothetical protein